MGHELSGTRRAALYFTEVLRRTTRGLGSGDLLDILEHPNPDRYGSQRIFVVQSEDHVYLVPFVEDVLTLTMVYAAIAPEATLRSTFGESLTGPVADAVVRNWGALIGPMGAMLIYGARKPAVRPLVLTVAGASKAIFIALVLSQGGRFLNHQAGIAIIVDLLWVLVFAAYLLTARRMPTAGPTVGTA